MGHGSPYSLIEEYTLNHRGIGHRVLESRIGGIYLLHPPGDMGSEAGVTTYLAHGRADLQKSSACQWTNPSEGSNR